MLVCCAPNSVGLVHRGGLTGHSKHNVHPLDLFIIATHDSRFATHRYISTCIAAAAVVVHVHTCTYTAGVLTYAAVAALGPVCHSGETILRKSERWRGALDETSTSIGRGGQY